MMITLACLFVCAHAFADNNQLSYTPDSLSQKTYFKAGESSVKDDKNVRQALARISELLSDESVTILQVEVIGRSSVDGSFSFNGKLSRQRADNAVDYLVDAAGIDRSLFKVVSLGEDWEMLENAVSAGNDPFKSDVLDIIHSNRTPDQKESALKALSKGSVWKTLNENYFPAMRSIDISVRFMKDGEIVDDVVSEQKPEFVPEDIEIQEVVVEQAPVIESEPEPVVESEPEPGAGHQGRTFKSGYAAVKNNLALDGALIANLGVEIGFGEHFSVAVPVTFSPYTINSDFWRLRTLSVQPEFRYWLKNNRKGHFFGVHGHVAYYNVTTVGERLIRYQDRDGRHPLYGAGLSYGYCVPFGKKKQWSAEFTLGGGYARLDYDEFHNVKNGILFETETKNYWGITNVGINIRYIFKNFYSKREK